MAKRIAARCLGELPWFRSPWVADIIQFNPSEFRPVSYGEFRDLRVRSRSTIGRSRGRPFSQTKNFQHPCPVGEQPERSCLSLAQFSNAADGFAKHSLTAIQSEDVL